MIILFSVFFLMKNCKSWRDFSASFTISTITHENVKKTGKVMVNGMQSLPSFPSEFSICFLYFSFPSAISFGAWVNALGDEMEYFS